MENKPDEKKNFWQKHKTSISGIVAGLLVISIWIWGWEHRRENQTIFENINVLFSGLAFAVLIITVLMQKEELELQRKELADTRAEFKQQNTTLIQQRFENMFFQLVNSHNEIVKNLDYRKLKGNEIISSGKDYFKSIYREEFVRCIQDFEKDNYMPDYLKETGAAGSPDDYDIVRENFHIKLSEIISIYDEIFQHREGDLGHYFESLTHLLSFINDETVIQDKLKYGDIVRAQISAFELVFIFYQGLSNSDLPLKNLIERFGLLKNLNLTYLFNKEHTQNYLPSAFDYSSRDARN